tara:strand:+ start:1162 stop:2148 length:987 start_codon:yes stop_codon:yes gene_type:complete
MIEDIFKNTIAQNSLLKKKDKIILGVSGGPDSVFMLYQFFYLKKEYKLQLACAHFNHSLRKEADQEEIFINELCHKLEIPYICEKKDVKSFFNGDSLEQTARILRYDFFLKTARQLKFKKLALGHHKDDLVETILMRLIRGTGLKGLRGFLPKTRYKALTVIRPLIETTKKDIESWLKKQKIDYCIDKSNFEEKFFRNRIRLKLLPLLKEYNPNIVDTLCNLAKTIAYDYELIQTVSLEHYNLLKKRETKREIFLDLAGLNQATPALFNNVLRITIEQLQGHTRRLEARHLDEVRDLALNRPGESVVDLPNLKVKKSQNFLIIQALLL